MEIPSINLEETFTTEDLGVEEEAKEMRINLLVLMPTRRCSILTRLFSIQTRQFSSQARLKLETRVVGREVGDERLKLLTQRFELTFLRLSNFFLEKTRDKYRENSDTRSRR